MSIHLRHVFLAAGAVSLVALLASCYSSKPQNLPTAAQVDIKRYSGHWYEIFRLPNTFQKDGARAQADYILLEDGKVNVVNSQQTPDGNKSSIQGKATPVEGSNGSRLQVRFEGFAALAPVPKEGNYWIIQVESDYSAALVGTPDRKFLWMLARDAKAGAKHQAAYVAKAKSLGFETDKLFYAKW